MASPNKNVKLNLELSPELLEKLQKFTEAARAAGDDLEKAAQKAREAAAELTKAAEKAKVSARRPPTTRSW